MRSISTTDHPLSLARMRQLETAKVGGARGMLWEDHYVSVNAHQALVNGVTKEITARLFDSSWRVSGPTSNFDAIPPEMLAAALRTFNDSTDYVAEIIRDNGTTHFEVRARQSAAMPVAV